MAVEGGVVQRGPPAAVRHVHAAQQRDDDLGAPQGVVGGGDVQRRLPVLVPRVDVCGVSDQNPHSVLEGKARQNRPEDIFNQSHYEKQER